jgi:cytochrome c-type biogenesis protein CcmH/NrfG
MPDADRPTLVPDLSPTERAIATMRARRDTAVCPPVGDEWLLLAEIERLQQAVAEADAAIADAYAIPGEDAA